VTDNRKSNRKDERVFGAILKTVKTQKSNTKINLFWYIKDLHNLFWYIKDLKNLLLLWYVSD